MEVFVSVSGGIAAYNKGVSRVTTYETIDAITTGLDYSNDVVARAQWFRSKGYWRTAVTELLNYCEIQCINFTELLLITEVTVFVSLKHIASV